MRRLVDLFEIAVMLLILSLALKACFVLFDVADVRSECGTLHSWDSYVTCVQLMLGGPQ